MKEGSSQALSSEESVKAYFYYANAFSGRRYEEIVAYYLPDYKIFFNERVLQN